MGVQACHCRGRTAPQFVKCGIFPAGACAWPGPEDHAAELFDRLCTLDGTQIRMAMQAAPWFLQLIEILRHSVVVFFHSPYLVILGCQPPNEPTTLS